MAKGGQQTVGLEEQAASQVRWVQWIWRGCGSSSPSTATFFGRPDLKLQHRHRPTGKASTCLISLTNHVGLFQQHVEEAASVSLPKTPSGAVISGDVVIHCSACAIRSGHSSSVDRKMFCFRFSLCEEASIFVGEPRFTAQSSLLMSPTSSACKEHVARLGATITQVYPC